MSTQKCGRGAILLIIRGLRGQVGDEARGRGGTQILLGLCMDETYLAYTWRHRREPKQGD